MRALVILCLLLSGCASTKTVMVPLDPQPNTAQVTEIRPSWFSTHTVAVVYDEQGKIAGVTGSGGQAVITVPLSVLSAGATLGGAYILGDGILKAGQAVGEASVDVTHELTIPDIPEIPPDFIPPGFGSTPPGLTK